MKATIKKDFFWNTFGTGIWNFLSLFLLIVVTRINGIDDSGIFSFAFSFVAIFFIIGIWGGRIFQISDVAKEFASRNYIFMRFITSIVMLVVAVSMIVINQYDFTKSAVILALTLFRVLDAVADAIYGIFQVNNKLYISGKSLTIKALVGFAAFVVIDLLTKDIVLASIALVVTTLIGVLFYDLTNLKKVEKVVIKSLNIRRDIKISAKIMRVSANIFALSILGIVLVNIPRYVLDIYHTDLQGYFGIIIMPQAIIAVMMSFALSPIQISIVKNLASKKISAVFTTMRKLCLIVFGVGALTLIVTWFLAVPVLNLIYNIDLTTYRFDLLLVIVVGILASLFYVFQNTIMLMRSTKRLVLLYCSVSVLLAILCLCLIDGYEIRGAIVALIVAYASLAVGSFLICWRQLLRLKKA
jgi:O-antigen/teichoic acid export membrane protein